MDVFDISPKGKKRFAKWIGKRHRKLCISELIRNSRDERQLFKMCRYIDRWYDAHEPSMKPLEASTTDEEPPEAPTTSYDVPVKHTRLKQHNFSRHVTHRLNMFIIEHPDISITKMIAEAETEDDLMAAMDEVENRKKVVDPRIKLWTVRRL